ncbi:MAG: S-4TM family putative pore-forming effector [Caldilineaceae bacterium]|nr:S-4TM family putative pore-forming effector [Caldilineaceae bacterium]
MVGPTICLPIPKLLHMSIQERQNQSISLARLASQRYLYSCAKKTRTIGMVLILLVAILGVVSSTVERPAINQWVPLFVIVAWIVDQLIFKRIESALINEAATIQEEFDCFVLDLSWPKHKGIQRITSDRLKQLDLKAKSKSRDYNELFDWYTPESIPLDPISAKMHCQKINCWWDVRLRGTWRFVLYAFFGILFLLALILSISTGITVDKLIAIAASFIRVFAWGVAEVVNLEEASRNIDRIHRYLSSLAIQENVLPSDIRSVQDEIFEHRRSNSPVPDWFYKLRRNAQEREAAET